jgi:hypothetical protein
LNWCGAETIAGINVNQMREQALDKLSACVLASMNIDALNLPG